MASQLRSLTVTPVRPASAPMLTTMYSYTLEGSGVTAAVWQHEARSG